MIRCCLPAVGWLVLAALNAPAYAEPVHLADGDSFALGQHRYRLYGIDAPELHQECTGADGQAWPCGVRARSELRRIIGTHPVECRMISIDRFERTIATCTAGGRDLAEEMVRGGYAVASARRGFSSPYEQVERQARADKRGLWAGTFEMPRDWRRANPRDGGPRDDDDTPAAVVTPREWLNQKIAGLRQSLSSLLQTMFGR